jgi:hypothetical protein
MWCSKLGKFVLTSDSVFKKIKLETQNHWFQWLKSLVITLSHVMGTAKTGYQNYFCSEKNEEKFKSV